MTYENIWYMVGGKIIETVSIDESSVSISQRTEKCEDVGEDDEEDDEVTHEVFFGENIKRIMKIFNA